MCLPLGSIPSLGGLRSARAGHRRHRSGPAERTERVPASAALAGTWGGCASLPWMRPPTVRGQCKGHVQGFPLCGGRGLLRSLCGGRELLPQGRCGRHLPPGRSAAGAGSGTGSSHPVTCRACYAEGSSETRADREVDYRGAGATGPDARSARHAAHQAHNTWQLEMKPRRGGAVQAGDGHGGKADGLKEEGKRRGTCRGTRRGACCCACRRRRRRRIIPPAGASHGRPSARQQRWL